MLVKINDELFVNSLFNSLPFINPSFPPHFLGDLAQNVIEFLMKDLVLFGEEEGGGGEGEYSFVGN